MEPPGDRGAEVGRLRLLRDGPAPGAWNMAMDEALMGAARSGTVTLRLYRWQPPCLSLGRNQPARGLYDLRAARDRGIGIVRRPTGGRAVYHHREVTYSVAAPDRLWGGPRAAYGRIHRAVARGLARLGVGVDLVPRRRAGAGVGPSARACFRDSVPGEVTCDGRKLVGSALWRRTGALLQHGSVLIRDEQWVAEALRVGSGGGEVGGVVVGKDEVQAAPAGRRGSIGLAEACPAVADARAVADALAAGFEAEFGVPVVPGRASAGELEEARRLQEVYAGREWLWRR